METRDARRLRSIWPAYWQSDTLLTGISALANSDVTSARCTDPISAYFSALNCGHAYNQFFHWFRDRQVVETHSLKVSWTEAVEMFRQGKKPEGADEQLWAVRQAVETFTDGLRALRIEYDKISAEPVMVVDKGGRQLAVAQLSDGEQNLMALVGDLVRRLAVTNPEMDDACQGEAVVMIDEIDLHLHPSWQRLVVPRLLKTFPKVQFLITTHSPQVLGEIDDAESVVFLEETPDGIVGRRCSKPLFGMKSGQILEDVMGASERDEEVEKAVSDAFTAIERGEMQDAETALDQLSKLSKAIPELERIAMRLRRKEMLGK